VSNRARALNGIERICLTQIWLGAREPAPERCAMTAVDKHGV